MSFYLLKQSMFFWPKLQHQHLQLENKSEQNKTGFAFAGIARGGGFQQIGAYVNLGAYYLVGAPIALFLGFGLKLNAKGLWMGTLSGSCLQVIILAIVTALTDWQKEVGFSIS